MAEQITLNPIADITQSTSAQNTINANNAVIETAFLDVLSLSGTAPNQMQNTFDMNSNQIINLPSPATANSPLRLQDASTLNGGGTVSSLPSGGTTGQVLAKINSSNFNVQWQDQNTDLAAGSNIVITGTTPATIATSATPTFTTVNGIGIAGTSGKTVTVSNSLTLAGTDSTTMTFPSTSGNVVTTAATQTLTNKTLTTPVISSITNTGTLTLPTSTDTLVGAATTNTLTNKTFDTAGAGNVLKINGTTISANTGTGSNVLTTSPTLVTPTLGAATATSVAFSPTTGGLIGTTVADSAPAGTVGEVISSTIAIGSAVSLSTGVAKTVTSITLTAGDWDVMGNVYFTLGGTTVASLAQAGVNTTTNAFPSTPDNTLGYTGWQVSAATGVTGSIQPLTTGTFRQNVSTNTTIFLVANANFVTSTCAAYGAVWARRRR